MVPPANEHQHDADVYTLRDTCQVDVSATRCVPSCNQAHTGLCASFHRKESALSSGPNEFSALKTMASSHRRHGYRNKGSESKLVIIS